MNGNNAMSQYIEKLIEIAEKCKRVYDSGYISGAEEIFLRLSDAFLAAANAYTDERTKLIPIERGGTGATSLNGAKSKLGIPLSATIGNSTGSNLGDNCWFKICNIISGAWVSHCIRMDLSSASRYDFPNVAPTNIVLLVAANGTKKADPIVYLNSGDDRILKHLYVVQNPNNTDGPFEIWYKNPAPYSLLGVSITTEDCRLGSETYEHITLASGWNTPRETYPADKTAYCMADYVQNNLGTAVSKSGDTMTGHLKIESEFAQTLLKSTTSNRSAKSVSYNEAVGFENFKDLNNYQGIRIFPEDRKTVDEKTGEEKYDLINAAQFVVMRNGSFKSYILYGAHNLSFAPLTTEKTEAFAGTFSATSNANVFKLYKGSHMKRDGNGRCSINTPVSPKHIANKEYVDKLFTDLVNEAPEELNTLKEIAEALNNDDDAVASLIETIAANKTAAEAYADEAASAAESNAKDYANEKTATCLKRLYNERYLYFSSGKTKLVSVKTGDIICGYLYVNSLSVVYPFTLYIETGNAARTAIMKFDNLKLELAYEDKEDAFYLYLYIDEVLSSSNFDRVVFKTFNTI